MSSAEGLQYMLSIESVENICRICFYEEGSTSLFATAVHEGVELNIQEVLETIIKTQIDENDNLPKYVCENCFILLLKTYKFINNCLQSNETLQCFKSLRNQVDFVKEEVQMEQFDDVENSIEVFKEESTSNREENATLQCDVEKPVVPSYSCYVCSKSFKSKTALKRHCTSHTGKKPFKCKLCFIGFSSVSNLARHRKVHSGEKPYKCDICPKVFSRGTYLREHKNLHIGVRPYCCHICAATFRYGSTFKVHLMNHTSLPKKTDPLNEKEKLFLCNICGKQFERKALFLNHYRIHTGEKPYECSECPKRFVYKRGMEVHLLTHTGEKPYSCSTCSKRFKQSTHLKRHLSLHKSSRVKPHECKLCGQKFAEKGNLIVHIRIHTGETPFSCNVCNKGFYETSSLKKHLKSHTGIMKISHMNN